MAAFSDACMLRRLGLGAKSLLRCAVGTKVASDEGKVRQELSDFRVGKNEEHDSAQMLNGYVG